MTETRTPNGLFDALVPPVRAALDRAVQVGVRGLHLDAAEVRAEFAVPATEGPAPEIDWSEVAGRYPPLAALARIFALSGLDIGLIVLAAAPEVESRFARAYALLQDDVTRRAPGFDLALRLLAGGPGRIAARVAAEGPRGSLERGLLLRLAGNGPGAEEALRVDPQILRALGLAGGDVDARLRGIARPFPAVAPEEAAALPPGAAGRLAAAREAGIHALHLRTGSAAIARLAAGCVAAGWDRTVLEVDLAGGAAAGVAPDIVARECLLFRHIPLLRLGSETTGLARLIPLFQAHGLPVLTAGPAPWTDTADAPLGPVTVDLRRMPPETRLRIWQRTLTAAGRRVPDDLGWLAHRFALPPEAIAAATAQACAEGALDGCEVSTDMLARAARRQTGAALGKLATRIEPRRGWPALVLPADTETRLREIASRLRNAQTVLTDWGFADISRAAQRTAALLAGPSGTGKTLAAEVIAQDLGVDLYRVDLAQVVDKYVGETEKNLDRIFSAAEEQDCLLFLDECEVLLGKRSEQREGRDKYANLEAAFLLQRIDDYRGTALMATNLLSNVDEAFLRRLDFVVHFPFPDEAQRAALWRGACPPALPLAPDVDFGALAQSYRLSGGNIANCVLAAAFLAAEAGSPVTQALLLHGVRREYQKMGQRADRN